MKPGTDTIQLFMGKFFNMKITTFHTKYPSHWSNMFIKANATLMVKSKFPNASKVKCISIERVKAIIDYSGELPKITNKNEYGQNLTYEIIE